MRMITKGAEPVSLRQHRAQPHSDYDNYAKKDELRVALVGEQMGLCCYCTGRIRAGSTEMKIEHWRCQATYPQQQLAYGNLLGACLGGEGQPLSKQHCDTRKANRDLKWNPAAAPHAIEARVRYLADGTIESPDSDFNSQLNEVLGLNYAYLKNGRKAALDSVLKWWRSTPNARKLVQQRIHELTNVRTEHEPFNPVAVWFLKQKLGGAAA